MEKFKGAKQGALSTTEKNQNHSTREPNRGKESEIIRTDQWIFSKKKIRKSDFVNATRNSQISTSFLSFTHKLKQNDFIFNPTVIVRDYAYTTEKYIAYNNAVVTEFATERDGDVPQSVEVKLTTFQQTSDEGNMLAFHLVHW